MKKQYSPPSRITVALIVAAVFAIGVGVYSPAQADPYLNVALGSLVGETEGHRGNIPFTGELGIKDNAFIGGVGHLSNADRNGNETNGEYFFVGASLCKAPLFCQLTIQEFFRGTLDTVYAGEAGLQQGAFRFTGRYAQDANASYRVQSVNAGYIFKF